MCHWVNKQWFIHKTKYYIVMKNNQEKDLFELTWSYFQDIPISKKKKKRHGIKVYHICYFLDKTKGKSLQKETQQR